MTEWYSFRIHLNCQNPQLLLWAVVVSATDRVLAACAGAHAFIHAKPRVQVRFVPHKPVATLSLHCPHPVVKSLCMACRNCISLSVCLAKVVVEWLPPETWPPSEVLLEQMPTAATSAALRPYPRTRPPLLPVG